MDLTPPSLTRSPSSPSNTYCPSERSSLDYPSPGLVEQQYKISSIYGDQSCSMNHSLDPETSLPPLDSMGHSDWSSSAIINPVSSASVMPSIISGEYDTFGNYPYSHDVYHAHPTSHAHTIHTSTPPPSHGNSRSPIQSASRAALSYTSGTSLPGSLTPRVKMETAPEYGQGVDVSHYPSPRSVHTSYPSDGGAYGSASGGYLSDGGSSGWHKSDYQSVDQDHYYPGSGAQASAFLQDGRRPYRVARPRRAPRRLTTKEEANFQCEVKGCGKLFSRSYNFKAHMETHDEKREYPFPCLVNDCNKKFVRKTDLQRHHQSVHMRERNHKCDYCGRLFARKDTLRRHMEDGCSKRFDIGTLDLRADSYDSLNAGSSRSMGGSMGHLQVGPPTGGLPPMAIPPLGSSGLLASMAPSLRSSRDLMVGGGDHSQGHHGWGR
ncbi:hypothetical protein B0T25DRAFT_312683 [Lasiosphaeria hispida]|uniref:C2H2-type domain-containing protein n=1 Tax=Lasiosphaeria hispida TaxID=260671 RepID=A0AAJ0M9F2_9PEZI|nr:hypothetical protein B0T25DRAFT_312683 [Lasiosphaeria hispida]